MRYGVQGSALALAVLAAGACPQSLRRGTYYRNAKHGVELWIPVGFTENKAQGKKIAEFHGGRGGAHVFHLEMCGVRSIQHFVKLTRERAPSDFPGLELKVFRENPEGGLPAAIFLMRKLDANPSFRDFDLVEGGVFLGNGKLLRLLLYAARGRGDAAVREARWMLATVRTSGERGLDFHLGARRLHLETGMSYRPPLRFEEKKNGDAGGPIYEGARLDKRISVTLEKTEHRDLDEALQAGGTGRPILAPWDFPNPGTVKLRGGVYATRGDGRRTVVAARQEEGPVFLLTCSGEKAAEDTVIREAELFGMSLDIVDVDAAHDRVAAATAGLSAALNKRNKADVRAQVKTLARYTYLPQARSVLARSLTRFGDTEATVTAVRALAGTRDPALLPALLRAAHHTRNQGLIDPLIVIYEALGQVRGAKAIPVLLKQAQRDKPVVRAAAIRTLGFYAEHRTRVVKELARLMKREEASGRKASPVAKERWEALRPVFREALERLTGKVFDTARDAQQWLSRKPKR